MRATEHHAAGLVAVANDAAATVVAFGRECVDGAFEGIEIMRDAVCDDFQRLVVFVAADFAGLNAGMKLVFRLASRLCLENPRRSLVLVSFDHGLVSSRDRTRSIGSNPAFRLINVNELVGIQQGTAKFGQAALAGEFN